MASLWFHTLPGASSAAIDRASVGARWVKICDSGQIVRAHGHGCKVFWRPFLSERDAGDCGDGAAWAGEVWRDLQANGGEQPSCLGFRNEMNANVRNAAEYLRYRATLRSFGYRGLVALGSFAVGTPDWPEWALLKQGLAGNVPDCLEVHEYWDLTIAGSATYYALRHVEAIRRGLLPPEWPLFPGEIGSDGIWRALPNGGRVPVEDPQGRRGWQDRGKLTAAQQSANLAAYAAGCAPSVVAAFVFADGGNNPQWDSFATFGTPVEQAIRATWGAVMPPIAQPKETTLNDLFLQQWKSRKVDIAVNLDAAILKSWLDLRSHGDASVGVPLTEEFNHGDGTAQIFTNKIALWSPSSGVRFI